MWLGSWLREWCECVTLALCFDQVIYQLSTRFSYCSFQCCSGQLAVAAGNHSLAQQSFRMAHENSQKCSGADAPATLALLTLATHTPTTLVDLLEHYGKSSGSEGVAASVDDRQEWEDIEDD